MSGPARTPALAGLFLGLLAGGVMYVGCRTGTGRTARVPTSDADVLLLAVASSEAGPFEFRHGFHTRLVAEDGQELSCTRCHHPEDPDAPALPWRCLDCHPGEKTDPRFPDLPT